MIQQFNKLSTYGRGLQPTRIQASFSQGRFDRFVTSLRKFLNKLTFEDDKP